MINRVNGQSPLLAARKKFNNILKDLLANKKHHYIIDLDDTMSSHNLYTPNNYINMMGKVRYWRESDHQMEQFDIHKLPLHPRPMAVINPHKVSARC